MERPAKQFGNMMQGRVCESGKIIEGACDHDAAAGKSLYKIAESISPLFRNKLVGHDDAHIGLFPLIQRQIKFDSIDDVADAPSRHPQDRCVKFGGYHGIIHADHGTDSAMAAPSII